MSAVRAIFVKQLQEVISNHMVLPQFVVFPAMAWAMTEFVAKADDTIPDGMFVAMFATVFAGMLLTATPAGMIAEDRESGSLRLMVMAGVRAYQYLLGTLGVFLLASLLGSLSFAAIGGYNLLDASRFILVMMTASLASLLLGATLGIMAPNQQAATGLTVPVSMVLGFLPMVAMFNSGASRLFDVVYTQQLSLALGDLGASLVHPLGVMLANMAVLVVLFGLAYRTRGLKG